VRAAACAAPIAVKAFGASAAKTLIGRDTVGSEATDPNTPGSACSRPTLAKQFPPIANATARSHTIFPGSWLANAHSPERCFSNWREFEL
jgi:hypothetical protein